MQDHAFLGSLYWRLAHPSKANRRANAAKSIRGEPRSVGNLTHCRIPQSR